MDSPNWTQELLDWLRAHPGWGAGFVFLVSFLESLVLIGILLPGIMILFGVGALIGLAVMDVVPVWVAASSGAFLGDSFSYALGYRYRQHLLDIWPFSRYPALMQRGARFFQQHGTPSVIAGRFIGPLRPVIPAVVGIMGMRPARFLGVDLAASVAWAPSFLVPGILFGASLEVASEYTGRLAVVLVIVLVVLWLTWWLLRMLYEPVANRSARWLRHGIRWARRHPVLGRLTGPLLDPSQPEILSVTMLGILLTISFWALAMLLFLAPFSSQPQALDQWVSDTALSLRNHLADPVMVAIAYLARWQVMLLSGAAVLVWLVTVLRFNAAVHWLLAVGGGILLQVLLGWTLRATPEVIELPGADLRGPSPAMSLATVVLVFFAVMIAREVRRKHRQWPYLAAGLLVTLLAFARLYLGQEWLSGALMGVLLGLAWTLVVGIAYRQRALRPFSGAMATLVFYGSLIVLWSWQVHASFERELAALQAVRAPVQMAGDAWWGSEWRTLPVERGGNLSVASRRFQAQVAAPPALIEEMLAAAGWEHEPASDWRWILQALNPEPEPDALPLLGRAFEGRSEALVLRRALPEGRAVLALRVWDSGVRLHPGGRPLYLVQLTEEHLQQRLKFFSYWRARQTDDITFQQVRASLAALEQKTVPGGLLLLRER